MMGVGEMRLFISSLVLFVPGFIDCSLVKQTVFLLEQGCYTPETWPTLWPSMDEIQSFPIPDSRVISVKGYQKVQLSRNPLEFKAFDKFACKVAFVASQPGKRLLLHWKFFAIGESRWGMDWLNVLDHGSDLELSGKMWGAQGQAIQGAPRPPTTDYHSISSGFSLAYKGRPHFDAFTITLTEFEDILRPGMVCPEGLFACQPGYPMCLSPELVCNSVINCGSFSNSDEDPEVCVTPASRLSEKAGTPVGLIGALCGIVVTALVVAAIATSVYFLKRHRHQMERQQRLSKPHSIDTLAEINSYRPKAQNIYNRPESVSQKPHPHLAMLQVGQNGNAHGGATSSVANGGDTYHNDNYRYNQDSMRLVNPSRQPDPRHMYESIGMRHSSASQVPPPFLVPGMQPQPFSEVYHAREPNEINPTWPSHNAVYYNDMGEETPLYQEI